MNKWMALGCLMVSCCLNGEILESYGIVKPTKEMPTIGILHFKENDGLELEGYFSRLEGDQPIEIAVWTLDQVKGKPFCVGAQCESKPANLSFPLRQYMSLGFVTPDKNGYGEISLKIKGITLDDLSRPNLKVLVHPKDQKANYFSENLIDQKYSMVELRWIED